MFSFFVLLVGLRQMREGEWQVFRREGVAGMLSCFFLFRPFLGDIERAQSVRWLSPANFWPLCAALVLSWHAFLLEMVDVAALHSIGLRTLLATSLAMSRINGGLEGWGGLGLTAAWMGGWCIWLTAAWRGWGTKIVRFLHVLLSCAIGRIEINGSLKE